MCLSSSVKKVISILENFKISPLIGYSVALLIFALSAVLLISNLQALFAVPLLFILAIFVLIFTKKSKFYGAHTARLFSVFVYFVLVMVMHVLFPEGESRWYGDCLMTSNGQAEIQSFFGLTFAFLSYHAVKFVINGFTLNKKESVKVFNADLSTEKNVFCKVFNFVNGLRFPHKFGLQLFAICILGHLFFGFTNVYLYNSCEEYNYFNGTCNPVGCIGSWKVMDALLLFVSILVAVLSFKVRYKGAMFVRICTLLVFAILNLTFGYVYSLSAFRVLMLLSTVLSFYLIFRFLGLRFLFKNNGNYGV